MQTEISPRFARHCRPALTLAALLACALSLAGCARQATPETAASLTLVDKSLQEAASRITADLALLSGSTQQHDTRDPTGILSEPMDLVFDGPISQALEKICARTGFRFAVVGRPRQVPVLVHLHARGEPILNILRDIGLQTGPYERLRVVEQARLIELVWLDPAPAAPENPAKAKARSGAR